MTAACGIALASAMPQAANPTRLPMQATLLLLATLTLAADDAEQAPVGRQPDGRIVVPTNQVLTPAGKQVTFLGRPVDLALAEGGKTLVVKNMKNLVFLDAATGAVKQTLSSPAG